MSDAELRTVLEALSYVFEQVERTRTRAVIVLLGVQPAPTSFPRQAAYHTIKPANLPAMLEESGVDESHAAAVASAWEDGAAAIVTQLKETTMVRFTCWLFFPTA